MLLDTSRQRTRSMFLTPGLTSAPGGGAAWAEATLALSPSSPRPVIHVRMSAPHRRNREDVPCQLGRGDEGKRLLESSGQAARLSHPHRDRRAACPDEIKSPPLRPRQHDVERAAAIDPL